MILETVGVGHMQVNCYILASGRGKEALIIDPGSDESKIRAVLQKYALKPAMVVNTHGHYDHIGCDDTFGVPVVVHKAEKQLLTDPQRNLSALFDSPVSVASEIKTVEDGDSISLDSIQLKVLHIPGHSPGGIALLLQSPEKNIVFSGDSLFFRGIGRTDFDGGDEPLLIKSIQKKLLTLPPETVILPGHGARSTIGEEKERNPFLRSV